MRPVRTAARAMLAGIFVTSGAKALTHPDPLVPAAQPFADRVGPRLARLHKRAPSDARTLVQLNGAVQFVGGMLLLTGLRRPAAAALAASLVPTTLAGHRFWEHRDPQERGHHQTQFLKNLGLIGGLLLAALDTEGRPGLRYRTGRLVHDADRAVRRTARETRRSVRLATRAAELGRHLPG
jgi:putative oxidoreductase